jgi:hypothetical protein
MTTRNIATWERLALGAGLEMRYEVGDKAVYVRDRCKSGQWHTLPAAEFEAEIRERVVHSLETLAWHVREGRAPRRLAQSAAA